MARRGNMARKRICPINSKTKEKFECNDCSVKDSCIQDVYDDAEQKCMRVWARADKIVSKIMKEKRGIFSNK